MEDSKLNLESEVSEGLETLKERLEWLVHRLESLKFNERCRVQTGSSKLNNELDFVLTRLGLDRGDFSEQIEGLIERLDLLSSAVDLQDLTFKELVKLETRCFKLNDELNSVLERLGVLDRL